MKTFWIFILLSILLFLSCSKRGGDEGFLMDVHEDIMFTNEFLENEKEKALENISKEFEKYPEAVELFYKSALKIDTLCHKESLILNDLKNYFGFLELDEKTVYLTAGKSNELKDVLASGELEKSLYPFHRNLRDSIILIMSEVPMVDIDEYVKNNILLLDINENPENRFIEDFKGLTNLESIVKFAIMEQNLSATNLNAANKLNSSIGTSDLSFDRHIALFKLSKNCIRLGDEIEGKLFLAYFGGEINDVHACLDNHFLVGDNYIVTYYFQTKNRGSIQKNGELLVDFKAIPDSVLPFQFDYFVK